MTDSVVKIAVVMVGLIVVATLAAGFSASGSNERGALSESEVVARCQKAIEAEQSPSATVTYDRFGEKSASKVPDGWDVFIDFTVNNVTGQTLRMKGLCFVESYGARVSASTFERP